MKILHFVLKANARLTHNCFERIFFLHYSSFQLIIFCVEVTLCVVYTVGKENYPITYGLYKRKSMKSG